MDGTTRGDRRRWEDSDRCNFALLFAPGLGEFSRQDLARSDAPSASGRGADINGSDHEILNGPQFTYIGADVAPTEDVSIILKDPYGLTLDNASIDIALSGQTLLHCEFFWLAFAVMARAVRPNGYLFLNAPAGRPIHRYLVDCYRFYSVASAALTKYAKYQLIDVWRDERGLWNDVAGFRRRTVPRPKWARGRGAQLLSMTL